MPRYRFYQLDVFASRPLAGNPLAVFPEADGLDPATMQALAREMNLSETTFVSRSPRATRRVRFFTPLSEIPLAGHPTIGTWWLLAELGAVPLSRSGPTRVTQETGAGVLPVEMYGDGDRPAKVVMTQPAPRFGATVPPAELGPLLGGPPEIVPAHPLPQVVATALPQLMVPIRSLADLEALPSGGAGGALAARLQAAGTDCAMCYVFEPGGPAATVRCRMFAPGLGVPEDPATGSAAGALGCYLVRHRLIEASGGLARLVVRQGLEIGRPSRIEVELRLAPDGEIREVRVGGQAVRVITGEVEL